MRLTTASKENVAVVLAPALATSARFWNRFVFDDVFVIERGTFIHELANLPRAFTSHTMVASTLDAAVGKPPMDTYRPLPLVSFFLDAALSGREPWAYHLSGLLLHALVCLAFLTFLRRVLEPSSRLPFGCALLFGLAPWLTEAHVWINGRSDVLVALFVLAALLAQRRALERASWGFAIATACAGLAALLSKETAVLALPFIALVPLPSVALRERAQKALPLGVAFATYMALRANALGGMRTSSGGDHLARALGHLPLLLWDGLFHVFAPTPFVLRNLRDDYADLPGWLSALAGLLLVALALLPLLAKTQRALIAWGLAFGMASLAPAMMISTEVWPGFGRYLYVPALGWFVALGGALAEVAHSEPRARLARRVLATVAFVSALLSIDATLSLRSDEATYARAIARAPEQAWAVGSLGLHYRRGGRCREAVPLLQQARAHDPQTFRYAVHLGRCLVELGERAQALDVAATGRAQFAGTRAEAGFLVIEVLARQNPSVDAPLLERCLRLDPARDDCRDLLAQARRRLAQSP